MRIQSPNVSDIAATITDNCFKKFAYLPQLISTMDVTKHHGITVVNSHLPSDMFNIVYVEGEQKINDRYVDDVIKIFWEENLPFAWWVNPVQTPELPNLLKKHALLCDETEIGMAICLSEKSITPAPHPHLTITPVNHQDCFSDWMSVFSQLLPDQQNAFYVFISQALPCLAQPDCRYELFVGKLDGMPVSTCALFYTDDVAGIFDMITLPQARRQGIATTMMTHAMLHAQSKGYPWITLGASEQGQPVYEKLGFKAYTEYRIYVPSVSKHV